MSYETVWGAGVCVSETAAWIKQPPPLNHSSYPFYLSTIPWYECVNNNSSRHHCAADALSLSQSVIYCLKLSFDFFCTTSCFIISILFFGCLFIFQFLWCVWVIFFCFAWCCWHANAFPSCHLNMFVTL